MFELYKKLLFTGVSYFAGPEGVQNAYGPEDDVKLEDLNADPKIQEKMNKIHEIMDRMEDDNVSWLKLWDKTMFKVKQDIMSEFLWLDANKLEDGGLIDKQVLEIAETKNQKDISSDLIHKSIHDYLDKLVTTLDAQITEGDDEDDVYKVLSGLNVAAMEDSFTQEQINQAKQTLDANRNNVLATQITLDSAYDISQDTVYQSKLSALDAAKTKLKAKKDMAGFENMIESVGAQTQALQDYVNDFNQAAEAAQLLAEAQQARTDALVLPLTQADAGVIVEPGLKQALLTAKAVLEAVTTTGDIQAQVLAYTQALDTYNVAVEGLNDDNRALDDLGQRIADHITEHEVVYNSDMNQFEYKGKPKEHTPTTNINTIKAFIKETDAETSAEPADVEGEILTQSREFIIIKERDNLSQVVQKLRQEVNETVWKKEVEHLFDLPVFDIEWQPENITVRDVDLVHQGDTIQLKEVEGKWGVYFGTKKSGNKIDLPDTEKQKEVETETKTPELAALETERDALLKQEITERQDWVILPLKLKHNFANAQTALEHAEWAEAIQTQIDHYTTALKTYNDGVQEKNGEQENVLVKREARKKYEKEPINTKQVKTTLEAAAFQSSVDGEKVVYELKEQSDGNYTIMLDTPIGDGYNDNNLFWSWKLNIENIDMTQITQQQLDHKLAQLKKTYTEHPDVLAKNNKDKQASNDSSVLEKVSSWARAKDTSNVDDQHGNN